MPPRRQSFPQLILGALFAFLFVRLLFGLVRALVRHRPSADGDRRRMPDLEESRASSAKRPVRIDRSSAIDVPFTEIPAGAAADSARAEARESTSSPGRRG